MMSARPCQVKRAVGAEVPGLTVAEAKDAAAELVAVVEAERVARHGAGRGLGAAVVARGAPAAVGAVAAGQLLVARAVRLAPHRQSRNTAVPRHLNWGSPQPEHLRGTKRGCE